MCQDTTFDTLNIRTCGTGQPLVLLHGWGMNSGAFTSWLSQLEPDYHITLIDLPGFGLNHEILPSQYTLDALCELITPYIPDKAIIVGWSLGGLIAQAIAAYYKNQKGILALVTIASTPCFVQTNGWAGMRADVLANFADQLDNSYEKTIERFLAIQAMGSDNPKRDARNLKQQIQAFPNPAPQALKAGLHILTNEDIRSSVSKITVPTLRLYGKLDSLVPVSAVDAIHEIHPQSDSVILTKASHAPFISHPEQTTQILNQFVSGLTRFERQEMNLAE